MNPWSPYQPTSDAPWNLVRVVHLHRRAGFAAPWQVLERDLAEGPVAAVDRILNASRDRNESFESLADSIAASAVASGDPARLKAWWVYRMLMTNDPLTERLTLMWHNHFATSNLKVENLALMHQQNMLMRQGQRAQFQALLTSVLKHPAMLIWLDADANRKGHPNENLARELLELFTLGIGNYSESDVRHAARALTGWSVKREMYAFSSIRHDDSSKTVLGKTESMNGDQLIEHLCNQPATARRLAWRLCQTFMGESVASEKDLAQLAAQLRASQLDIGDAVECILKSNLFFSDKNIGTRVSSPVEYGIGALRAADLQSPPPSSLLLSEWFARMGQDLFYPPNVGGWNEGRSWLSSRAIVARANFAHALTQGELWNPKRVLDWSRALPTNAAPQTSSNLAGQRLQTIGELLWGRIDEEEIRSLAEAIRPAPEQDISSSVYALLLSNPRHILN